MLDVRIRLVRSFLGLTDGIRYQKRNYDFSNLNVIHDLSYSSEHPGDPSYSLDLYWPEKGQRLFPVLIDIHGGGFVYGDKELNQWTCSEMASRGYFAVALNYPLVPEMTIPDQIKVLYQAFKHIAGLANDYPMDLDRVFLKGDSAGGFLAMLAASMARSEEQKILKGHPVMPLDVKALALVHPMVEMERKGLLGYTKAFFHTGQTMPNYLTRMIRHMPPTWIVSSRNDVMFNQEARKLVRWMRRLKKPVQFHEFGYTVKRPLIHIFMVTMNELPESQKLYDSLDRFLRSSASMAPSS